MCVVIWNQVTKLWRWRMLLIRSQYSLCRWNACSRGQTYDWASFRCIWLEHSDLIFVSWKRNSWIIPSFVSLKLTRNVGSLQPAYCVSESSGLLSMERSIYPFH